MILTTALKNDASTGAPSVIHQLSNPLLWVIASVTGAGTCGCETEAPVRSLQPLRIHGSKKQRRSVINERLGIGHSRRLWNARHHDTNLQPMRSMESKPTEALKIRSAWA